MHRLIETFRRGFFENIRFAFSAMREHKDDHGFDWRRIGFASSIVFSRV